MDWENKIRMVQLGNQRDESTENKIEFQKFVLDNIHSFDSQSWDMFCNLVDLIIDEMKKDIDFWKQVYIKIKDINIDSNDFGFRAAMRISMIKTICEDELLLQ